MRGILENGKVKLGMKVTLDGTDYLDSLQGHWYEGEDVYFYV